MPCCGLRRRRCASASQGSSVALCVGAFPAPGPIRPTGRCSPAIRSWSSMQESSICSSVSCGKTGAARPALVKLGDRREFSDWRVAGTARVLFAQWVEPTASGLRVGQRGARRAGRPRGANPHAQHLAADRPIRGSDRDRAPSSRDAPGRGCQCGEGRHEVAGSVPAGPSSPMGAESAAPRHAGRHNRWMAIAGNPLSAQAPCARAVRGPA